jgi:hypothetical protein
MGVMFVNLVGILSVEMKSLYCFKDLIEHQCDEKILEKKYGSLSNYRWREILTNEIFKYYADTSSKLSKGRHGSDADSSKFKNIEFKSASSKFHQLQNGTWNLSGLCFEFDKQHEEKRRLETISYDAFAFAAFDNIQNIPLITLIINNSNGVKEMNKLIKKKQIEFLKNIPTKDKRMIRDSIKISFQEVIKYVSLKNLIIIEVKKDLSTNKIGIKRLKQITNIA